MKAVKGNKEYSIDDTQQKTYQNAGFDIVKDGEVIAYGRGKTVPYDDYMKADKEIRRLNNLAADRFTEIESLKEEIEKLRGGKQEPEKKSATKKAGE